MSLKLKLILLTLIPLIMVSASIGWISIYQAQQLGSSEVKVFRENLIKTREAALQDSVEIAMSAIRHVYSNAEKDDEQAKQQVKKILHELRYGEDGYFFVYDKTGTNLVHPILPELVGQNLIDLQDEEGDFLIEALLF